MSFNVENAAKPQNMDAIVVGMGILGLMLAKRLTDFGQSVAVVEQAETLASGPSIKNHGWLHTGVVHTLSQDSSQNNLAKKLQYGHRFFNHYAPECIDEPFKPTYAVAHDTELAEKARRRWHESKVPFKELSDDEFFQIEPGLDKNAANYFFETNDSRINNRLLFAKLETDIRSRGAQVLTAASYDYEDDHTITVSSRAEGRKTLRSPLFFYATGNNLGTTYEKLTDEELPIEYWKSHLLIMPRVTESSVIGLDRNSPIIINHQNTSVINRSYDDAPINTQNDVVDDNEVEKSFQTLVESYPFARKFRKELHAIACLKPHIKDGYAAMRHNVSEVVYEPKDGHIFALPGKMTEAPYVADTLIKGAYDKLNLDNISKRPIDIARIDKPYLTQEEK